MQKARNLQAKASHPQVTDVKVSFEFSGLQKEDVSIDVHNDVVTVSGDDKTSSERGEGGYCT